MSHGIMSAIKRVNHIEMLTVILCVGNPEKSPEKRGLKRLHQRTGHSIVNTMSQILFFFVAPDYSQHWTTSRRWSTAGWTGCRWGRGGCTPGDRLCRHWRTRGRIDTWLQIHICRECTLDVNNQQIWSGSWGGKELNTASTKYLLYIFLAFHLHQSPFTNIFILSKRAKYKEYIDCKNIFSRTSLIEMFYLDSWSA